MEFKDEEEVNPASVIAKTYLSDDGIEMKRCQDDIEEVINQLNGNHVNEISNLKNINKQLIENLDKCKKLMVELETKPKSLWERIVLKLYK